LSGSLSRQRRSAFFSSSSNHETSCSRPGRECGRQVHARRRHVVRLFAPGAAGHVARHARQQRFDVPREVHCEALAMNSRKTCWAMSRPVGCRSQPQRERVDKTGVGFDQLVEDWSVSPYRVFSFIPHKDPKRDGNFSGVASRTVCRAVPTNSKSLSN